MYCVVLLQAAQELAEVQKNYNILRQLPPAVFSSLAASAHAAAAPAGPTAAQTPARPPARLPLLPPVSPTAAAGPLDPSAAPAPLASAPAQRPFKRPRGRPSISSSSSSLGPRNPPAPYKPYPLGSSVHDYLYSACGLHLIQPIEQKTVGSLFFSFKLLLYVYCCIH